MNRVLRRHPYLYLWRYELRITQMEAAKLLGISQSQYSKLERGESASKRRLAKIAAMTNIPIETLIGAA